MREAAAHRFDTGVDDVLRCVEIGLADLQMHDRLPLGLQLPGPGQDLKCGLSTETLHTLRQFDRHG